MTTITAVSPTVSIKPAPVAVVAVDLIRVSDNGRNMHIVGIFADADGTHYVTRNDDAPYCGACQSFKCNHTQSLK